MIKNCKKCDGEFKTRRSKAVFCSKECFYTGRIQKQKDAPHIFYCEFCSDIYENKKLKSRFCSKSCASRSWVDRPITHGMTKTREYRAWANMLSRCNNPNTTNYERWGGRGISVCYEWEQSFELFLKDMGKCPDKMSIDRIDNDGNYEIGNCRWATQLEQAKNRNNNHFLTYAGETLIMSEWARRFNIVPGTISGRLILGWSVKKALTTPVNTLYRRNK